jgi:hypothetical protein
VAHTVLYLVFSLTIHAEKNMRLQGVPVNPVEEKEGEMVVKITRTWSKKHKHEREQVSALQ